MSNRNNSILDFVLGLLGYICAHIDLILTRSIAVLTIAILLIRLYRMFKKPATKQNEEEI